MTSTPDAPARELYRPRLHYTPAENWMNDPNGLLFHRGVYHLFYQHNPYGTDWGNMSWGHATSTDLLTWAEQPVAIHCDREEAIFSGSAVVDERNTAGFGDGSTPPLVAIYTSAYTGSSARPGIQAQSLAYSLDEGRTWTKHAGNPVLDRGSADFRDPKVFWYDGPAGAYWVMVAVEAAERRAVLYRSANLTEWEYLSDFRSETPGVALWECPDLFELPVDGDHTRTAWVLLMSVNPGGVAGGSGMRYFIGEFDGVSFTQGTSAAEGTDDGEAHRVRDGWLDWGRDYYAAVSFNGLPHRRVTIAWMSNWEYAAATPTGAWRSAMSLPRELSLRTVEGELRLVQAPIAPAAASATQAADAVGPALSARRTRLACVPQGEARRVRVAAPPLTHGSFGLRFATDGCDEASVVVDTGAGEVRLDRRSSGLADFHDLFASVERAPLEAPGGRIELEVYLDACSLEVFIQGGLATITDLVFPRGENTSIEFFADAEVAVDELEVAALDGPARPRRA